MNYKLSKYLYVKEKDKMVMIYNLITHFIFGLSTENYLAVSNSNLQSLKEQQPILFSAMCKLGVIIPFDFDELDYVKALHRETIFDKKEYRLTINPTLECNFHCWYCYESHPQGRMSDKTAKSVYKHIVKQIESGSLQYLLLDWFGGEPLLYFDEIIYPISKKIQPLLKKQNIRYLGSTTTNGYLINPERVKKFREIGLRNFQITLDGDEINHNKIRFLKGKQGSFQIIVNNINLLSEYEENIIMVRINYTEETLKNIDSILNSFSEKAKEKIQINFQQVWQDSFKGYVSAEDQKQIFKSLGFNINPFQLNTNYHVCYADRINEAVINYDGRVFKCTARDFTTQPEDGILKSDGNIEWNIPNYAARFGNATFENSNCLKCSILPVCMGPCSQKMVEFEEGQDFQPFCLREGMVKVIEQQIEDHYNTITNSNVKKYKNETNCS
jgi:uncharacterized protein